MAARFRNVAARFRKVYPLIWHDERFQELAAEEKLVALYVLTCPQSNRIGLFRFSVAEAAECLGMVPETFAKRFERVVSVLNWGFDKRRKVVFIPTWWKYNTPDNPNTLKGNLADLDEVPQGELTQQFAANLAYLNPNLHETFRERLANVTETMPKPSLNQEQEQEQEQEIYSPDKPARESAPEKPRKKRPAKERKPREADPLFDAVAEVASSDPKVNGAHVAKVANLLRQADPPFTPDEVRRLPGILRKQTWWKEGQEVTRGCVQNHIALVRKKAAVETRRPEQNRAMKAIEDAEREAVHGISLVGGLRKGDACGADAAMSNAPLDATPEANGVAQA